MHFRLAWVPLTVSLVLTAAVASGQPAPSGKVDAPGPTPHAKPDPAIDGKGAFATGKYRNLFAEDGRPQAEIDAKLNKAFDQLFHGDKNNQTLFFDNGSNDNGPLAYIEDFNNHDVRTEGMSYGMMIAVQMDKKAEFDALWNWAFTYMYYNDTGGPNSGYFAWTAPAPANGRHATSGPAPDGEQYFTMALYFAAHRWPGGKGIYDYKSYADKILVEMLHHPNGPKAASQPASQPADAPAAGRGRGAGGRGGGGPNNMFNESAKMVRFVPGAGTAGSTDPSYHLPAFYELWARWGPEADRAFWVEAATASRDLFSKAANPETGLCPDQCSYAGAAGRSSFQADAWRCQSNIAVDWSWFAKDPREQDLSNKVQATFAAKGMETYPEKMSLDAKTVISARHVVGLEATNATAGLAATDPRAKDFTEALWNAPIPDGQDRYYSGCLYLMNYMHCAGKFRIW